MKLVLAILAAALCWGQCPSVDSNGWCITGLPAAQNNLLGPLIPFGNSPEGAISWPGGVPTIAAGTFTQPTISWPMGVPTIAAGVFTQPSFAGSALGTHTHSTTATGSVSAPSFTGNSADNRSAFVKVIFCSKN